METLLNDYNLDLNNIFKVVTDNASNIKKAFKEMEDEESDNETGVIIVEELDLDPTSACFFDAAQRIGCFAHTLQLVLSSFIRKFLESTSTSEKMNSIIGHVKKSVLLTEELVKYCGKTSITPFKTRWGSYVDVIGRFLELQEPVKKLCFKNKWAYLSEEEVKRLADVYTLTKLFSEILNEIQAEIYMYMKLSHIALFT